MGAASAGDGPDRAVGADDLGGLRLDQPDRRRHLGPAGAASTAGKWTASSTRLPNDDLHWTLNEQMTPRWSAASGWEFMVQSLLMHGDAFAKIIRRGPLDRGLEPLHPLRVYVMPNADASG
jgi:hypothetical protein